MSSQMEREETAVPVDNSAQEPLFGIFDIVILGALAFCVIYWFFFRNKKNTADVQIKQLTMVPTVGRVSDSSFITKMKTSGRNVVVFYGSQTGTAEEFASRLAKDAVRYGMKGMVADPEECDMEELNKLVDIENSLAIFCMATYGEGDPTDNAQEFFEFLQSGNVDLLGVRYSVFGLGNKTYEHYNDVGKYVDKRLEELGAERVFELGLGDDDGNLEEDFITWREAFWPAICTQFGIENIGEDVSIRQYAVTIHEEPPEDKVYTGEVARLKSFVNQRPPYDAKNPFLAPVRVNKELYKGGDRSCMHIEFDITDSKLRYETGDHVAVYPTNDEELVERIGKLLNTNLDTVFTLTNVDEDASKKHPFPCPCSYRTALSHYLDITSLPNTNVLKEISDYATNEDEKQKLIKMATASAEGKTLYSEWIIKASRNIAAVLEDLPSVKPAIDHLCELLPRLHSRYYSISSSPKIHPSSIHITAVLIKYTTPTGRINKGVATNWLADKKPQNEQFSTVPIFVRRSQFRLPFKHQTPVVMIGPGTGLAPFRGFIQERQFAKQEGKPVGDTILYFGCRKKAEDFMYQEELEEFLKNGTLQKMYCAFSRDQDKKIYVYHLLKENSGEIWKLLEAGGHIYVCGDARIMARDVHKTVEEIICAEGKLTPEQSAAYIKKLETQRRYSADVWS